MKHFFRLVLLVLSVSVLPAATSVDSLPNAADVRLSLEKLNVLGSVLYIAAHPDDENTGLMAYLSKERKYRAAYLSVTRGDGGQNLIGSEKDSDIGIMRSQELLAARHIDGGEQYFTRAIDFGYSKSVEESMQIWGRDKVLADIVWIIRRFRPDIIVTRFPADAAGGGGHGHHTAGTILALEAFTAAADAARFPEQLQFAKPWQAKRILLNSFRPNAQEQNKNPQVDIGIYNPYLGQSYNEIAAYSRTMHKSQGFGTLPRRGSQLEFFQLLEGSPVEADIMEGIDTSWKRLKGGEEIERMIAGIISAFQIENPSKSLPQLLELDTRMAALGSDPWIQVKRQELRDLIQACAGLWLETLADDYSAAPGGTVKITASLVQRSGGALRLNALNFPTLNQRYEVKQDIPHNTLRSIEQAVTLPPNYPISQPYWLMKPAERGLYSVSNQQMIGMPQNPPALPVDVDVNILGKDFTFTTATRYRWVDRVDGEKQRPFEVRPPVTANFNRKVVVFNNGREKEINLTLKNNGSISKGSVRLQIPSDWQVSPASIQFDFSKKHDEQVVTFRVRPPLKMTVADAKAIVAIGDKEYSYSLLEILHSHIDPQVHFTDAGLRLIPLESKIKPGRVGYIEGSGDEIPEILKDMGYEVVSLSDDMLTAEQLAQFNIVIAGIRAYNTRERLRFVQPLLMEFVKNGGTYIVQYNVPTGLQTENIGPYPFRIGRSRIVEEDAELRFLEPTHPLVTFPNAITSADFSGWVQERGLYFAEQWDSRYTPIFAGHDSGEQDSLGSTLYCRYGRGVFVYSTLVWFRELPAGVPGAFRLFQNLLSVGEYEPANQTR
jgi:LmbE family N-acetylglucosaminyl deacetylase